MTDAIAIVLSILDQVYWALVAAMLFAGVVSAWALWNERAS